MSSWVMNTLWKATVFSYQSKWALRASSLLSTQNAQSLILDDLKEREAARQQVFKYEKDEMLEEDILKKVVIRAKANLNSKSIDMPEYFKILDRVDQLQKLQFVEEWALHEPEVYEWMKHKIAADVGGTREREAFHLYESQIMNEKGEVAFRLWRENIEKDPQANFLTTSL